MEWSKTYFVSIKKYEKLCMLLLSCNISITRALTSKHRQGPAGNKIAQFRQAYRARARSRKTAK